MSGFNNNKAIILALLWKNFRLVLSNKVMLTIDLLFPCFGGVLIILISLVQLQKVLPNSLIIKTRPAELLEIIEKIRNFLLPENKMEAKPSKLKIIQVLSGCLLVIWVVTLVIWVCGKLMKRKMKNQKFESLLHITLTSEIDRGEFKAKAMPTAGGALFLQTLFCAANNTCEDKKNSDFESFKPSVLTAIGEELKGKFNLKSSNKREINVENWAKDFYVIDSLIEAIEHENEKKKLLYTTLLRSKIYEKSSAEENHSLVKLSRMKRNIYRVGILNSVLRAVTEDDEPYKNKLNVLTVFFCGPNMRKIQDQLVSAVMDENSEQTFSIIRKDPSDTEINEFCKELINTLDNSKFQQVMYILKPLIIGKVVYTPDAPVINKIMDKVSDSFKKIKEVINSAEEASKAWEEMKAWNMEEVMRKYKYDENFLKEAIKTKIIKAVMQRFEGETSNFLDDESVKRQIKKFQKLLNETEENYKVYLQQTDLTPALGIVSILQCINFDRVVGFSDQASALSKAKELLSQQKLWGYVAFTNVPAGAEKLPSSVSYTLRVSEDRAPDTNYKSKILNKTECTRSPIIYHKEILGGTAYLQSMIEGELIRELTGKKFAPGIYLKQLPYPCYKKLLVLESEHEFLKLVMPVSWLHFFCRIVKSIVLEKEILFRDLLRVFGALSIHHWIAYFLNYLLLGILPCLLSSLIYSVVFGNFLTFFVLQLSYILALIPLAFLVSTFFGRSNYCSILSSLMYMALFLFSYTIYDMDSAAGQFIGCFIAIVAVTLGSYWITNMNTIGIGPVFSQLNHTIAAGSFISMTLLVIMLLIDGVIYFLLTLYFENILQSGSGKKRCYYCFLPSYWKGLFKKTEPRPEDVSEAEPTQQQKKAKRDSKSFEKDPDDLPAGIELINVTKEFGSAKSKLRVVNNLTLNFYESQITSFLGHNGAGKSTTVAMMTGILPVTKGTIRINGVDLQKNPSRALRSVGICMQENIILGDLSVEDHMVLIGKLKNLTGPEIRKNVIEILEAFEMQSRANQRVKQLSGGWKRKVCVAMAFMGGSRIIFLDEPTAGIDPFARRSIWNFLIKLKQNRTIVLITHHLDEADVLGDRIAIIAAGELKCCGSSSYLKSQCNKSYILTVDSTIRSEKPAKKSKNSKKAISPQAQEILGVVRSAVGGSEFEEERGNEILFSLPPKQSASDLNRLFDSLEKNKKRLNISTYGISAVSLEEVFLRVLEKVEAKEQGPRGSAISISSSSTRKSVKAENDKPSTPRPSRDTQRKTTITTSERITDVQNEEKKSSESLPKSIRSQTLLSENETQKLILARQKEKINAGRKFWNHFAAIIVLRFIHFKRNYIFLILQVFGLLAIPALSFLLSAISSVKPSLTVDVSAYDSGVLFYSNNIPDNPNMQAYEKALLGPYGLGIKCVLTPDECSLKEIPKGSLIGDEATVGTCSCETGNLNCTADDDTQLPSVVMSTGHRLFNLTGLDLETWVFSTEHIFKLNRIGGFTFGHSDPLTGLSTGDFVNLFSGKKLFEALNKLLLAGKNVDPKELQSTITAELNNTYGEEIFKDKDVSNNIIVWFNSGDKIASMALMNGVNNLVLRASLPAGTDPSSYSIKLVIHPLEGGKEKKSQSSGSISAIMLALAFLFATVIIYAVDEKTSGMKHLQIICGVTPLIYWLVTFLWDIIVVSAFIICLILLELIFGLWEFCGKYTLPVFLAVLFAYAFTTLIFVYLVSHVFRLSSNAFTFVLIWLYLCGILTLIYDMLSSVIFKETREVLNSFFIFIPEFSLMKCLQNLVTQGKLSNHVIEALHINLFSWDLTTKYIVHILYTGGAFLAVLLLVEYRNIQPLGMVARILASLPKFCAASDTREDDEDVVAERERVLSGRAKKEGDMFIIKNLSKVYCGKPKPAVNHISVGVKHGECLGLLGMNGAGKTTTFKMISGHITPTSGDATIAGFSISYRPINSRLLIGYCPQMNALDPYLTPKEHLTFFCQIRGYTSTKKKKEVDAMIELMNLGIHKNKLSKNLSGGNQRKLNAAIALLCEPELILLDEPTAGMDVLARRFLWSRMIQALQDGRCLVLTTHSMEECQALATQVCIMYMGRFECFGSSQHLKNKFNEGYSISVRLTNVDKTQEFTKFLSENLPGSNISSSHCIQLVIKLHPDTQVGKAISAMGEAKRKMLIEDFSVTQTSLENVFLKIIGEANRTQA